MKIQYTLDGVQNVGKQPGSCCLPHNKGHNTSLSSHYRYTLNLNSPLASHSPTHRPTLQIIHHYFKNSFTNTYRPIQWQFYGWGREERLPQLWSWPAIAPQKWRCFMLTFASFPLLILWRSLLCSRLWAVARSFTFGASTIFNGLLTPLHFSTYLST